MKLDLYGTQLNIWGLYCAIGALSAFAAMGVICASRGMKKGSIPVLGLTSLILGTVCSRVLYCLVMTLTKVRMPLSSWLQVSEGGWSLFGMIGGVLAAAWVSAKIMREKPLKMLDAVSVGLPLMIAAERMGEGALQPFFEGTADLFNLSRQVAAEGLLTIVNQGNIYLATYRIDTILAMIMFLTLAFSIPDKKTRDGDLWIRFMILCGAGGVLAESLRYDDYLVYSFVRIQQVLAAILLFAGVALSGRGSGRTDRRLYLTAVVSMILTIAECIGLEFSLDRSRAMHSVLYGVMVTALLIPVAEGFVLLRRREADPGSGRLMSSNALMAAKLIAVSLSATEVIAMILEMGRIHSGDKFLVLVLASAAAVFAIHSVMILLTIREIGKAEGNKAIKGAG